MSDIKLIDIGELNYVLRVYTTAKGCLEIYGSRDNLVLIAKQLWNGSGAVYKMHLYKKVPEQRLIEWI